MSKPKTTSELIHTYAGILNNIVREGTQGSYTYHGVLGCFLNEWLEMDAAPEALEEPLPEKDWDTQEEIYEALTESLTKDDQLLEQLEEKTRQALNLDDPDPAIMRAFNKQREAWGLE